VYIVLYSNWTCIKIMYILRVTTNEVHRLLHTEEGCVQGFLHTAALAALEA
jgi:hypothetical protein